MPHGRSLSENSCLVVRNVDNKIGVKCIKEYSRGSRLANNLSFFILVLVLVLKLMVCTVV